MRSGVRLSTILPTVVALGLSTGCHAPERADAFFAPDRGWSRRSVPATIALYLPNRIVDLLDVVHVGLGVGPGLGAGLHGTRHGYLLFDAGVNAGIGWFGRYARPYRHGLYVRVRASRFTPPGRYPEGVDWHVPRWDVAVYADAGLVQALAGFAPNEFLDFVVGWSTYDLRRDDW